MAHGGKRSGAGRKRGSRNKLTVAVEAALASGRRLTVGELKATLTEAARELTVPALQTLADIMSSPHSSETGRIACAVALLERGWGKSAQVLEHNLGGTIRLVRATDLSDDELASIATGRLCRAAELTDDDLRSLAEESVQ